MAIQGKNIKGIIFIVIAVFVLLAQQARAADDPAYNERVKYAKMYLEKATAEKKVDWVMNELARDRELHLSASDITDIKSSVDLVALRKAMLDAMVKTFTLDELKMLAEFYTSPVGQSIEKKMPSYLSIVMPAIQDQIKAKVIEHLKKMQKQEKAAQGKTTAPAPGSVTVPAPALAVAPGMTLTPAPAVQAPAWGLVPIPAPPGMTTSAPTAQAPASSKAP